MASVRKKQLPSEEEFSSSQEERIAMLRVVLQQKAGHATTDGHYQPYLASANKSAAHLAEEDNGVFL